MDAKKQEGHRMVGGMGKNAINKLGEAAIQAFIRRARAGTAATSMLSDGGGMYLEINGSGVPVWRLSYWIDGKERCYTIGTLAAYPLAEARRERETAKALIRDGRDPVRERRLQRAAAIASSGETFAMLAEQWLAKRKPVWSAVHYDKSKRALERDVLPKLGDLPVAAIKPIMVTDVVEAILKRGTRETAARVRQHIESIFKLGIARGLLQFNPADPALGVLPPQALQRHRPALLTFPALGELLRGAETAHLTPAVGWLIVCFRSPPLSD